MRHPIILLYLFLGLAAQVSHSHGQQPTPPENPVESAAQGPGETSAEKADGSPADAATAQPVEPASLTRIERQEEALRRQLPADHLRQLESGDDAFLGLFLAAARPQPRGGVVLIANRGEHADWPELIGPARRQLSSQGWHTLAISLPETPPVDPAMEEADRAELMAETAERTTRRINIAVQTLQAEGAETLVLLGRGEGAFWALHASAADARPRVEAAALILVKSEPPARARDGSARLETLLTQWQKPVYEIFDGTDTAGRERARQHELSAQRHAAKHYQQLLLLKPDRSELGQRMLIKRLEGWLDRTLVSEPLPRNRPELAL